MKKTTILALALLSSMTLMSGCAWQIGGDGRNATIKPTLGQQLVDLQRAKESGAITDAEFQTQKKHLLEIK